MGGSKTRGEDGEELVMLVEEIVGSCENFIAFVILSEAKDLSISINRIA